MSNKQSLLNKIASLNIDIDNLLNNDGNSYKSLSNNGDKMSFLIDILRTLEPLSELKSVISDALVNSSENIAERVKDSLKKGINEMTFCSADTTIPNAYTNKEFTFDLGNLDTWGVFKLDVDSIEGGLVFNDVSSGFDTRDLNTFIALCIRDRGQSHSWVFNGVVLFDLTYMSDSTQKDKLILMIPQHFNGVKIAKYFSDVIDSIELFDTRLMVNKLLDDVGGVTTVKTTSFESMFTGLSATKFISDLVNDSTDSIDANNVTEYFNKSVTEYAKLENKVNKITNGLFASSALKDITVPITDINELLSGSDLTKTELNSRIDTLLSSGGISVLTAGIDDYGVKNVFDKNLLEDMVKGLTTSFLQTVLSPKIRLVFELGNMLMDPDHKVKSFESFIAENFNVVKTIGKVISDLIIDIILLKCVVLIKRLVSEKIERFLKDQINNTKKQKQNLSKL